MRSKLARVAVNYGFWRSIIIATIELNLLNGQKILHTDMGRILVVFVKSLVLGEIALRHLFCYSGIGTVSLLKEVYVTMENRSSIYKKKHTEKSSFSKHLENQMYTYCC